jgi:hypothetical protein
MYNFKRRIFAGRRHMDFWFGLTSKSRDRHSNFTLYLLTEGPDSPFSHAEQIKSGIHSKSEAERIAIHYAKDLLQNLIEREKEAREEPPASDTLTDDTHE